MLRNNKGITVYCASSVEAPQRFVEGASALGVLIARCGKPLITGAGCMGLMGAVNDACIAAGGSTVGVIPQFMVDRGWHHTGLSELVVTDSMHQRKKTMAEMSMAAIALPGGFGTLEELLEIITWRQLGLYDGNIVILNIDGYYDNLLAMIDHAVATRVIHADHPAKLYSVATTPEEAVQLAISQPKAPELSPKF